MNAPKIKNYKQGPERQIQDRILAMLRNLGWFCMETHGNMYSSGFPDLYATHSRYGIRWIEVKNPGGYSFTQAQRDTFPKLTANGTGIWILTDASQAEYQKLFQEPNWYIYLLLLNERSANIPRICATFGSTTVCVTVKETPIPPPSKPGAGWETGSTI